MPYGLTPMVPQTGFEPMTLAASTRCSTTELPRRGETDGSRTRNNLIDSQVPLPFGLSPLSASTALRAALLTMAEDE